MRIAVLSHAYLAPESRKSIEALAPAAEVMLLLPARWPGPGGDYLLPEQSSTPAGVTYLTLKRRIVLGQQYLLNGLRRAIRAANPDLLMVEYEPWSLMLWQARRAVAGTSTKLVAFPKKNTLRTRPRMRYLLKRRIGRRALAACAHVFAASQAVAELMRTDLAVPPEHISTAIHIGVDTGLFTPASAEMRSGVIGYCGMLGMRKGSDLLIEAVAQARERTGLPLRLKLLGASDGTLDPASWEAHDWIEHRGWTDQPAVAEFLRGIDIFVLPARRLPDHEEHDGHALMEAMSCGCACIATAGGIVPELLGEAGTIVPDDDSATLADAIAELAQDEPQRHRLGAAARAEALGRFDNHVVAAAKLLRLKEIAGV